MSNRRFIIHSKKKWQVVLSITAVLIFAQSFLAQKISSEKRAALVIGNSNYSFAPLPNPVRDARLIGRTLGNLNFKVTVREDLTLAEMKTAVEEFTAQLPKDGIALFYFGGHGTQVGGRSFILPVDFKSTKDSAEFVERTINIDELISTISRKSGLNIIILDACRNGEGQFLLPSETEKGLAAKTAPAGTLIAYSTSPGKTADDGDGENSLYAAYLAENLRMQPSRLEDVFKRTRLQMINYTGETQIPWENSSLVSDFYFTPDRLAPSVTIVPKNFVPQFAAKVSPQLPSGIKALQPFEFNVPVLSETGARSPAIKGSARFYRETAGSLMLEMVEIAGSQFQMGTSAGEADYAFEDARRYNDELTKETITAEMPQHLVKVPGFFMSKTEITQAQWQAVMRELPEIKDPKMRGANLPVVNVSWGAANEFCEKLTSLTDGTRIYRLPTEAEWEYAARGGTTTPFAFGKSIIPSLVNFIGSAPFAKAERGLYRQNLVAVGQLNAPNQFGLYDMHGNVWEWTADVWHPDYDGAPTDGSAWETTTVGDDKPYRVVRGGSWDSIANSCRSAYRRKQPADKDYKLKTLGFRVVAN